MAVVLAYVETVTTAGGSKPGGGLASRSVRWYALARSASVRVSAIPDFLDRDVAVEKLIAGPPYDTHGTAADGSIQTVRRASPAGVRRRVHSRYDTR